MLVDIARPQGVGLLSRDGCAGPLGGRLLESLGIMGDGRGHRGRLGLHGGRAQRGHGGPPFVELGELDAMGVLEHEAEGIIKSANAVDLGHRPSVLLEGLGPGLAAGEDALDGVEELLLRFVVRIIFLL